MTEKAPDNRIDDVELAHSVANAMAPRIDQAIGQEKEAASQREVAQGPNPRAISPFASRRGLENHAERLEIYAKANREVAEENATKVVRGEPLQGLEEQEEEVDFRALGGMHHLIPRARRREDTDKVIKEIEEN
jgi:hypothetical protein